MFSKFKVSKSTVVFKIASNRLIDEYPKLLLLLHLKLIKEVLKENASELK